MAKPVSGICISLKLKIFFFEKIPLSYQLNLFEANNGVNLITLDSNQLKIFQ
jgi:hypothetical protein